jgi:hypothetical protein
MKDVVGKLKMFLQALGEMMMTDEGIEVACGPTPLGTFEVAAYINPIAAAGFGWRS